MGAPVLSDTSAQGLSAPATHGSCFLLGKVKVCTLLQVEKGLVFFFKGVRLFEAKDPAAGAA